MSIENIYKVVAGGTVLSILTGCTVATEVSPTKAPKKESEKNFVDQAAVFDEQMIQQIKGEGVKETLAQMEQTKEWASEMYPEAKTIDNITFIGGTSKDGYGFLWRMARVDKIYKWIASTIIKDNEVENVKLGQNVEKRELADGSTQWGMVIDGEFESVITFDKGFYTVDTGNNGSVKVPDSNNTGGGVLAQMEVPEYIVKTVEAARTEAAKEPTPTAVVPAVEVSPTMAPTATQEAVVNNEGPVMEAMCTDAHELIYKENLSKYYVTLDQLRDGTWERSVLEAAGNGGVGVNEGTFLQLLVEHPVTDDIKYIDAVEYTYDGYPESVPRPSFYGVIPINPDDESYIVFSSYIIPNKDGNPRVWNIGTEWSKYVRGSQEATIRMEKFLKGELMADPGYSTWIIGSFEPGANLENKGFPRLKEFLMTEDYQNTIRMYQEAEKNKTRDPKTGRWAMSLPEGSGRLISVASAGRNR